MCVGGGLIVRASTGLQQPVFIIVKRSLGGFVYPTEEVAF